MDNAIAKLEALKQDILNDVRVHMQTTGQVTQYIGARYVPLFAEPLEWDDKREYEPLTIVLYNGNSYTSRQFVPAGTDINDEKFWAITGNYNAQIEQYRNEVKKLQADVDLLALKNSDYGLLENYGGGADVPDNYNALVRCLGEHSYVKLLGGSVYKFSTFPLGKRFTMFSDGGQNGYYPTSSKYPVIKGTNVKFDSPFNDNVGITFIGIGFDGCVIDSAPLNQYLFCNFDKTVIKYMRVGRAVDCFFNDSTIEDMVDSIVIGCTFSGNNKTNLTSIKGSVNSSIISNCRLQWAVNAFDLNYCIDTTIIGNWIDRCDVAFNLAQNTNIMITGNTFRRSVKSFFTGDASNIAINGNTFWYGELGDGGTSQGYGPKEAAFNFTSVQNIVFTNNTINYYKNGKIFGDAPIYVTNSVVGNIAVNGKPLDSKVFTYTGKQNGGKITFPVSAVKDSSNIMKIEFTVYHNGVWLAIPTVTQDSAGNFILESPLFTHSDDYLVNIIVRYRNLSTVSIDA